MSFKWPFLDHPYPIAFAHRGGSREFPENTMAAFEGAVALGYRYLETDVHATSDGVLVAFHDDTLDRVTDREGSICDLPWSEVRRARVDGEPIPLLEDVVATWPDTRVNIDPKDDAAVAPLITVLRRTAAFPRVCVTGFSDRRMRLVRRLTEGRVCTATSPGEIARVRLSSYAVPAGSTGAACVQAPVRVWGRTLIDQRFVDAVHRLGMPLHVWTVDEGDAMERLLDLGVDGIMSDRPSVLKAVLVARGAWPKPAEGGS